MDTTVTLDDLKAGCIAVVVMTAVAAFLVLGINTAPTVLDPVERRVCVEDEVDYPAGCVHVDQVHRDLRVYR